MVLIGEIVQSLQVRGQRVTIQRRRVLEVLCEHEEHLAVHDVRHRLVQRGLDLPEATVYRIVQWLKEQGVVSQTDLGHQGIVYQIVSGRPHHHLVCLNCQHVIDLDDSVLETLRDYLRTHFAFEPRIDHMAFFGLCHDCQERTPDQSLPDPS